MTQNIQVFWRYIKGHFFPVGSVNNTSQERFSQAVEFVYLGILVGDSHISMLGNADLTCR